MARVTVGVMAIVWVALLCPAICQAAGELGGATLVAISADPDQLNGGEGSPDCSTSNPCTYTYDGGFIPAIRFVMRGPGSVDVSADIWGTAFDCSSEPDGSVGTSLDLPGGPYIVYIIFRPAPVPGDTFAITWYLGTCPAISCALHSTPHTLDKAEPPACAL
jgi:hypothetical protein